MCVWFAATSCGMAQPPTTDQSPFAHCGRPLSHAVVCCELHLRAARLLHDPHIVADCAAVCFFFSMVFLFVFQLLSAGAPTQLAFGAVARAVGLPARPSCLDRMAVVSTFTSLLLLNHDVRHGIGVVSSALALLGWFEWRMMSSITIHPTSHCSPLNPETHHNSKQVRSIVTDPHRATRSHTCVLLVFVVYTEGFWVVSARRGHARWPTRLHPLGFP
jgi:hypothetical protein